MDNNTFASIIYISALISLVIFIYVISLIKNIEYNTREPFITYSHDKFMKYIICDDLESAKKYIDSMFANDIVTAIPNYDEDNPYVIIVEKYRPIYLKYNISTPSNFDRFIDLAYVKEVLDL